MHEGDYKQKCGLFSDYLQLGHKIIPEGQEKGLLFPSLNAILPLCHADGGDDHGRIHSESKTEQEGSEGTQPPAAENLEFQSRY